MPCLQTSTGTENAPALTSDPLTLVADTIMGVVQYHGDDQHACNVDAEPFSGYSESRAANFRVNERTIEKIACSFVERHS